MSFNPATIPSQPFIGAPFSIPINLAGGNTGRAVPLQFIWLNYGVSQNNPSAAVSVNLAVNNQTQLLGSIRGVYIDNTGSDCSIYVYFPDTQITVPCGPFAAVWSPVLTGSWQFTVVGRGFSTNDLSQTLVTVFNVAAPPAEINELNLTYPQFAASPSISRGFNIYSNGFASPAIGDQYQTGYLTNVASQTIRLFNSPYAGGGIITLTDWSLYAFSNSGNLIDAVTIQSTGASGTYFKSNVNANATSFSIVAQRECLQHKLNAAETWEIITPAVNAGQSFTYHFGFSYKGTSQGTAPPVPVSIGLFNAAASGSVVIEPVSGGVGGFPFGGMQFTPTQTFFATSVELQGSGTLAGTNPLILEFFTDNGGSPNIQLYAQFVGGNGSPVPNSITLTSSLQLNANQTYWVTINIPNNSFNAPVFNYHTQAATGFNSGRANTAAGLAAGTNMPANSNFCWSIVGQSA